jgi:hypothetical protein
MNFKTIVSNLYTNIDNKDNNMDIIKKTYDNIDTIKNVIKDYCFNIKKSTSIIEYKFNDMSGINPNTDNMIELLNIYRLCIHKLIEGFKYTTILQKDEILSGRVVTKASFKSGATHIKYHVTVAETDQKVQLFMMYLLVYYMECATRKHDILNLDPLTLNSKPHVGIDYEFNNRIIALMQINFETYADLEKETTSYIWLVQPKEFTESQNKILIKYLMTNPDIYKVLHGPDSLDIPYMYDVMFEKNQEIILAFTKKLIDTRFLCEYAKYGAEIGDRKCSIYDALEYFGTISKEKYDSLKEVEEDRGPVQDISWDIHKLSTKHKNYAFYDVLFLKFYLIDIYKKINELTPEFVYSCKYINPILRFVLLDRREVIKIIDPASTNIAPINNYWLRYKGDNHTLSNVFKEVIKDFKVCVNDDECIDFNFLLLVGFIRKSFLVILKQIVYYILKENYTLFQKKLEKWEGVVEFESSYQLLKQYELFDVVKLVDIFKNEAFKKIMIMFPKKNY